MSAKRKKTRKFLTINTEPDSITNFPTLLSCVKKSLKIDAYKMCPLLNIYIVSGCDVKKKNRLPLHLKMSNLPCLNMADTQTSPHLALPPHGRWLEKYLNIHITIITNLVKSFKAKQINFTDLDGWK